MPRRLNKARDQAGLLLVFDVGNTHTHVGLANARRVLRAVNLPTASLFTHRNLPALTRFIGRRPVRAAALSSVVPKATPRIRRLALAGGWRLSELSDGTARSIAGLGIDYPNAGSIGPDRLANALAAKRHFRTPCVVVDFGTAVTFDVLDRRGRYAGGIIAPGLAAMTDYLHEKTALLPKIKIQNVRRAIGKSTKEAMLIGAVHGYRGLVRELLARLRQEFKGEPLTVVATGGFAELIAGSLPEITAVVPWLTLEGLRLFLLSALGPAEPSQ